MNTYKKIYYEDFRKKFAYERSIDIIKTINEVVGTCDTWEKAHILKQAVNIATSIAQGSGSVLSNQKKDFFYKVAIKQTYQLIKSIANSVDKHEISYEESNRILKNAEETIKLLRTYRKKLKIEK